MYHKKRFQAKSRLDEVKVNNFQRHSIDSLVSTCSDEPNSGSPDSGYDSVENSPSLSVAAVASPDGECSWLENSPQTFTNSSFVVTSDSLIKDAVVPVSSVSPNLDESTPFSQSHGSSSSQSQALSSSSAGKDSAFVVKQTENAPVVEEEEKQGEKKPRVPTCAKCRAHNIYQKLKNHKRSCQFMECECLKCYAVQERRFVMSKDIDSKRKYQRELEKAKEKGRDLEPIPKVEKKKKRERPVAKNVDELKNVTMNNDSNKEELFKHIYYKNLYNKESLLQILFALLNNKTLKECTDEIDSGKFSRNHNQNNICFDFSNRIV
ncbi:doublesex- and mab-3-related transcription factor C2-like isoform X1 [Leptotrombidium deliense]|uniref:Doublesex-and mab-3-related transcription factor C2-like isoform X1 n=1 Tax=Leptotrombidium deliense TaxID=299467 RepID=A0A443S9P2_9ACAR|nr:doublesex- and mab-3-related transcription factor C2-like isoform X1 [Leptotrombidium deliense]